MRETMREIKRIKSNSELSTPIDSVPIQSELNQRIMAIKLKLETQQSQLSFKDLLKIQQEMKEISSLQDKLLKPIQDSIDKIKEP